jgi:rubrerythrin
MAKRFKDLTEQEILALAITAEEEDSRIYGDIADRFAAEQPATAKVFEGMREEEIEHRNRLTEEYRKRFGEHIPLIRRSDVKGFVRRKPVWQLQPLGIGTVSRLAATMEMEARRYYERSIDRCTELSTRQLLNELADAERGHIQKAEELENKFLTPAAMQSETETKRRLFVLQVIQPGLAGLMDGSVSTLAPLFAAAFATHSTGSTFRVGLAAAVGAGISMAFAEGLSDDGTLTGRGKPLARGIVCGVMTAAGGIFHTLPYLFGNFHTATAIAIAVVACELLVISFIRNKYMDTPFLSASFQVIVGGVLVFLAGILIGTG